MSLLQNEDFLIWHLRTSYLSNIKDGVGERLINVNSTVLNSPAFRAAGWTANAADTKRTYSPPIPTAITSDYFQAPIRSAGLPSASFADDEEDGGMVTGVASNDIVGQGPVPKRRRKREQEEDDSSDLSDESDEDTEGTQRAAQQIRFAKMPVRTRSGSSPIRSPYAKNGPAVLVTSPSKPLGDNRLRRESVGAVEAVKQRARRDTTTSSEGLSSENDLDPSLFKRKQIKPAKAPTYSTFLSENHQEDEQQQAEENAQTDEDSGEESDGTTLSSEFADSGSLLDDVADPLTSSPLRSIPHHITTHDQSPKKCRTTPSLLQDLPPPRPISVIQPVSALGLAIKARRKKPANPLEAFARLSGKGIPEPLLIKIYAPFSENPDKPYDMPLQRTVKDSNSGGNLPVTVADTIGLSLWIYNEEGLKPPIQGDGMNVNRWTMRMVEDGEVEFDFPALGRTRPIADFTSNNNRAATRGRGKGKLYDEFALVGATEDQFKENERLTPNTTQASTTAEDDIIENPPLQQPQIPQQPPAKSVGPRFNPVLGQPFISTLRNNSTAPADSPTITTHSTPRMGATKLLKIRFTSPEAFAQTNTIEVTTDTYIAEVLDTVCKKWGLDKAHHILKVTGTNTVAPLDRTVEAIGARTDLDLIRRRFGNEGPLSLTGSPGSSSPNAPLLLTSETPKKNKRGMQMLHSLAQKQDPLGNTANYKKFNVVRKQPMSFSSSHQRILLIDDDYMHIMPGETGKTLFDTGAKTTTIPFSSVVGCKVSRRHPKTFRVVVFKERETKRYDFEAQSVAEAAEIVVEIKKGMEPFQDMLA
ncbi:MAG: hypothetical protein M1830_004786 [Pleopsidium flavum]|nr:MAG: hypothetical protein M1830_004786 [Pleopsidium flavum]